MLLYMYEYLREIQVSCNTFSVISLVFSSFKDS